MLTLFIFHEKLMNFELSYRRFSEQSILVEWPQNIDEFILKDVLLFKQYLATLDVKSILQINNAYNSLLIIYNFTIDDVYSEITELKTHYRQRNIVKKSNSKLFKIPVCYDEEFGLDLEIISAEKQLPISQIIALHSQVVYTVFFIGFLPGFLYLGGLDKQLHFPRKKNPRQVIKKGAVAIGGQQTGIYPNVSPGGWNIIGNCPLEFFIPKKETPCFASAGDKVKFIPVSRLDYDDIVVKINSGNFIIENEDIDG